MGVGGQDGVVYFNKPPLVLWIHGLVLWLLGPTLVAARLPSLVAALLTVIVLVRAARRTCGDAVALLAGVILATTIEFVRHTHAVSIDLWHALFVFAAAACFSSILAIPSSKQGVDAGRNQHNKYIVRSIIAGVWIGLALMSKPLLALLVFPMLLVPSLFARGSLGIRAILVALGASLVVALPWHLCMVALHGDAFISQYFGREIADRALGGMDNLNTAAASPFYYIAELARTGWPWLATTLLALVALARRQQLSRSAAVPILLGCWVIAWFGLLSAFPDKRSRYLLVLYPPAAWISAQWIIMVAPVFLRRWSDVFVRAAAPVAIVGAIVVSTLPITMHRSQSESWNRFFAFLDIHPHQPLWQGGFIGSRAARVYLVTGAWPVPTHDTAGRRLLDRSPPPGVLIAYHSRDGLAPGVGETLLFQDGDLSITRLDVAPWQPIPLHPKP